MYIADEQLRKFVSSEYGLKILLAAQFAGQETFKYGKKSYRLSELVTMAKVVHQIL